VSGRFLHDPASSIASYRISAVSAGVDPENPQDLSAMRHGRTRTSWQSATLRSATGASHTAFAKCVGDLEIDWRMEESVPRRGKLRPWRRKLTDDRTKTLSIGLLAMPADKPVGAVPELLIFVRPPLRHNPLRPCALGDQVNAPVTIANGISRC
jgi:hypothetical protein